MNVRRTIMSAVAAAAVLAPGVIKAEDTKWYEKVEIGGYVETYYQYLVNHPSKTSATLGNRAFANQTNQFAVNGGELTFKSSDEAAKTGYFVDLVFGPKADSINSSNTGIATNSNFMIGQAYVTQALGDLTVTLGKFGTIVGWEVGYTPSDSNFSRSVVYTKEPFYHTGLKLDYALPAGFTLTGMIGDGNSVDKTTGVAKDYGFLLNYSGIKDLSLIADYYRAPGSYLSDGSLPYGDAMNFMFSYTLSETLSFAGEYLYNLSAPTTLPSVNDYRAKEQGYSLYATYVTPVEGLSISPRFGQWFTPDSTPNGTDEYTLTVKYSKGALAHYLEYRSDASTGTAFTTGDDNTATTTQQTVTYAAVYSY